MTLEPWNETSTTSFYTLTSNDTEAVAGCTSFQSYRTLVHFAALNTTVDGDSHVVTLKVGGVTVFIGTANDLAFRSLQIVVPPGTTCSLTTPAAVHNDTICAVSYTIIENR